MVQDLLMLAASNFVSPFFLQKMVCIPDLKKKLPGKITAVPGIWYFCPYVNQYSARVKCVRG